MPRLQDDFFDGTLSSQLLIGATTLQSAALANFPTVASPDTAVLVIDPDGASPEVVKITAHSASATSATVTRGQDGTTDRTWASGTRVICAPVASDRNAAIEISDGARDALTIVDPNGGGYNVFQAEFTPNAALGQFYFRSSTGDTVVRPILRLDDYLGAPIFQIYSEGGVWCNDNIKFVYYSGGYIRAIGMEYLKDSSNEAPALIFGNTTNAISTVTFNSSSVTVDSGKGLWIRKTDSSNLESPTPITVTDGSQPIAPAMYWSIPTSNSGAALGTSLADITGSQCAIASGDYVSMVRMKLQARACASFSGVTAGDVLGVALYDNAATAYAITEGTATTPTPANPVTARTGWADVPSTAWRTTTRVRNSTAARGNVRGTWVEFRYIPS